MSKVEEIEKVAGPIVERHGCDLVLLSIIREKQGRILRLMVEKKGSDPFVGSGVDHSLCGSISRELGDTLEASDLMEKAFVLEVSSPGIERPLVQPADYDRFAGRPVKLKTSRAVGGRKRFRGVIGELRSGEVTLRLDDGDTAVIPLELVTKANLIFDPK